MYNEDILYRAVEQENMCKVVLTCKSVGEVLKRDHSNERYSTILSLGVVCYAVQSDSRF